LLQAYAFDMDKLNAFTLMITNLDAGGAFEPV